MKPDGENKDFDVIYYPDGILNYQKGVIWSSSNPNVATVNENGKVTSVSNGECTITATSTYNANISAFAVLTVSDQYQLFVTATTKWQSLVSGSGSLYNVYTEEENPEEDALVWNSIDTTVTVPSNLTEEEAKAQAALGVVLSPETRKYIVAQSRVVYWTDKEKDYSEKTISEIETYSVFIHGLDSDGGNWYNISDSN